VRLVTPELLRLNLGVDNRRLDTVMISAPKLKHLTLWSRKLTGEKLVALLSGCWCLCTLSIGFIDFDRTLTQFLVRLGDKEVSHPNLQDVSVNWSASKPRPEWCAVSQDLSEYKQTQPYKIATVSGLRRLSLRGVRMCDLFAVTLLKPLVSTCVLERLQLQTCPLTLNREQLLGRLLGQQRRNANSPTAKPSVCDENKASWLEYEPMEYTWSVVDWTSG
jgi:hypothetical protein